MFLVKQHLPISSNTEWAKVPVLKHKSEEMMTEFDFFLVNYPLKSLNLWLQLHRSSLWLTSPTLSSINNTEFTKTNLALAQFQTWSL